MAVSRKFDFIALGRAAVDLYGEQIGGRLEDMTSFAKYLGGCPANVSVGAARLGLKPAMLTRVGDEHMGRFVRETLAVEGVDVSHVRTDPTRLTALVILGIRDRDSFPHIFYRDNVADMAVAPEDFDQAFIASATALLVTGTHFSIASVDRTSRTAMRLARAAGTKIVFDIDYRPVLWGLAGHGKGDNRFVASEAVSAHLQSIAADCDLIVGTEDEFHIAGGSTDTLASLRRLREVTPAALVMKRGAAGCVLFDGPIPNRIEDGSVFAGFPVEAFNVLGAGDGFMAGLLRGWLHGEGWELACTYGNACGALVVSRHGCAPAMPSWAELAEFLALHRNAARLHDHSGLAHLHRTTTGRRAWPEVRALAFDHRQQFEALAARNGVGVERIASFKRLIAHAVKHGDGTSHAPGAGAIVDDRYGRDALFALGGDGVWLARPVERPGVVPLAFDNGDPALAMRAWPAGQVAKCLVVYDVGDPPALRESQETQLQRLQNACIALGHELLLELVPPSWPEIPDVIPAAMRALYAAGLLPDWWKLPPVTTPAVWHDIGDAIRASDSHCRGVLVLGLDSKDDGLKDAFTAAASEPLVRGFAVGRFIFWSAAEEWFRGALSDSEAMSRIAERFRLVQDLWKAARASEKR